MQEASKALVDRRYFDAERLAASAMRKAYSSRDYERLARIILPLQEARRLKRQLAFDAAKAGAVFVVNGELPSGKKLVPGCYLISPPRVGVDGRLLREAADRREVPVIITVREPATRDGLWPVVALGPVTVRAKVAPPTTAKKPTKKPAADKKPKPAPKASTKPAPPEPTPAIDPPSPEWFLAANELLGDAAIATVITDATPHARVDALTARLDAMPDHEKLHQRLEEAAREAARTPMKAAQARKRPPFSEEADEDRGD